LTLVRTSRSPDVIRRHAHNYYLLGIRRADVGAADEARAHLSRALEFDPAFLPALRALSDLEFAAGRFAEARTWLERALAATGPDPDLLFQLGNIALNLGEPQRALTAYHEAETLEHATAELRFNIGLAYLLMGESAQAETSFTQLLEEQPRNARVWDALGCALRQRMDDTRAATAFAKALELDATLNDARDHLAQLLLETQELAAARQVLERALQQEPDRRSSLHLLGMVYAGYRDFDQAAQCWQHLVDLGQATPEAFQSLAAAYVRTGNRPSARAALVVMLEQYPDHAYAHLQMGLLVMEDGETEVGWAHLDTAVRLAPHDPAVLRAREAARTLLPGRR
jgi:Tfp pilus assembly protein PilF